MPVAFTSTSTSPARGPSRSTVSIVSGAPAFHATAAWVFKWILLKRVRGIFTARPQPRRQCAVGCLKRSIGAAARRWASGSAHGRSRRLPTVRAEHRPYDLRGFDPEIPMSTGRRLYRRFSRRALIAMVVGVAALTLIGALLAVNLSSGEKRIQHAVERLYSVEDPQFTHVRGVLLGPPVLGGNRYQVLLNGDQIFPSMLEAIRSARETINFETYIYWSEAIGKEFADALTERARAGVKVNVLLDWVGSSKMDDALIEQLKGAGVQVLKYHP